MSMEKKEGCKLYNEELKTVFVNENYKESTRMHILRLFSHAYDMEVALDKDLANFNFNEVEELLKSLNRKTVQSVYGAVSFFRKYVDYAIVKGYVPTRINYFKLLRGSEMLNKYVNEVAKNIIDKNSEETLGSYITRKELHRVMDFCINPQDGAIFGLLFEGGYGVELEELRNLKRQDCNLNTGEITFTRVVYDGEVETISKRKIIIEDMQILSVIEDAINQKTYEKNNGINKKLRTPRFDLAENDYVFRVSGKKEDSPIKTLNINNRLKKIATLYDNPFLNPKNIWISGQIDFAKKLMKELNLEELEREHYELINERFGYDKQYWHTTKSRISNYL